MIFTRQIERELLLSALDEDAVLSAAENIRSKLNGVESKEVLALAMWLAKNGVIAFYKYDDDRSPTAISTKQVADEIRSRPYGVFLQSTDATCLVLAELEREKCGSTAP